MNGLFPEDILLQIFPLSFLIFMIGYVVVKIRLLNEWRRQLDRIEMKVNEQSEKTQMSDNERLK